MNALPTSTKNIILAMGAADDPSEADQERIRRRLMLTLGAAAVVNVAATGSAAASPTALATGAAGTLAVQSASLSQVLLWVGVGAAVGVGVSFSVAPESLPSPSALSSRPTPALKPPGASARAPTPRAPDPDNAGTGPSQASRRELPEAWPRPSGAGSEPALVDPGSALGAAAFPDPEASALSEELRLLEQAQLARANGRCEESLQRIAEYFRRFPEGVLKNESVVAKVLCLCELGRVAEGRALANRLLASDPESALAQRLLRSCPSRKGSSR